MCWEFPHLSPHRLKMDYAGNTIDSPLFLAMVHIVRA